MGFEEAVELLGLDPACDPKQVRRAYLRQVKLHKPEQDPEGFRRVRDAYDLILRELPFRSVLLGASDESDEANAGTLSTAEALGEDTAQPTADESAAEHGAAPAASSPPSAAESPLDAYHERAGEATEQEAVAIWRQATSEHPDDAEAWGNLIDALDVVDDEQQALSALVEAYQAGHEQYGAFLLFRAPERAPEAMLEAAEKDGELRSSLIYGLMQKRQLDRALPLIEATLQSELPGSTSLGPAIEAAAMLGELGRWKAARRLGKLVEDWEERFGIPGQTLSPQAAAHWAVVKQLLLWGPRFPEALSRPLSHALAHGDLEHFRHAFERAPRTDKKHVRYLLLQLEHAAPALYAVVAGALEDSTETVNDGGPGRKWLFVVGFMMLFNVMRFAARQHHVDPPSPHRPPVTQNSTSSLGDSMDPNDSSESAPAAESAAANDSSASAPLKARSARASRASARTPSGTDETAFSPGGTSIRIARDHLQRSIASDDTQLRVLAERALSFASQPSCNSESDAIDELEWAAHERGVDLGVSLSLLRSAAEMSCASLGTF